MSTRPVHGTFAGAVEAECFEVPCGCAGARRAAEEAAADRAADLADLIEQAKRAAGDGDT